MKNHRFFLPLVLVTLLPLIVALAPHENEGALDSIANSAPPNVGGGGGPFNSSKIDLLQNLPLDAIGAGQGNVLGSDLWGWTDPLTGKEYALMGLTNATSFVDISDPTDSKYLGQLLTQTGNTSWRDIKTYANHAYIVSDFNDNHGMQIFDLTQLRTANPDNPTNFSATALYTGVDSAHNVVINEETGFAYIVGSNRANGGLHVVNIQNPTNPVEAGNFGADGYTHDAQVVNYIGPDNDHTGKEIAFCCNEDTLTVVDCTNKSNMFQLSRTGYPETGYTHQCWLTEDHRYLFLGDELDESSFGGRTRILVWDCLDLDNPVLVGTYLGETNSIDHNIYVHEDKVYVANYASGLRVLQINPGNILGLEEIAFIDTFMSDNDADFDGCWTSYPFFESGTVIISDRQNGLFMVRLSPLSIELPNGQPDLISPSGGAEFLVDVTGFQGTPVADSGVLHVDRGNGFETFPMNALSDTQYEAVFPSTECGETVRFFVSATSTDGVETCLPGDAPTTTFVATSADEITNPFADNFQTNMGWTTGGDASDGGWERGTPAGDGDRGDPTVDGDDSGACFLTDNEAGNSDVDNGTVVLTSPIMDAVGNGEGVSAFLSYYRWYSNDVGNAPASDIMEVEISNDNGQTWTNLETIGPSGNEVSGGWFKRNFDIADFVEPTDEMRVRFLVSDLGDGSVVEAGVDGVEITVVECEPEPMFDLGDVNMDGTVNLLDIGPFVDLLSSGGFKFEADMNGDGVVNLLDVQLFIDALSAG